MAAFRIDLSASVKLPVTGLRQLPDLSYGHSDSFGFNLSISSIICLNHRNFSVPTKIATKQWLLYDFYAIHQPEITIEGSLLSDAMAVKAMTG